MDIKKLIEVDKDAKTLAMLYKYSVEDCYQISKNNNVHIPLRRLFVESDGLFNRYMNTIIGRIRPPAKYELSTGSSRQRELSRLEQQRVISEMYESGGYATTEIAIDGMDKLVKGLNTIQNETASRRVFLTSWSELKNYKIVNRIINDLSIREISDAYLGCKSILNMIVVENRSWN